ncbi:hypothetical protein N0V90_001857 [Kalmusia sp. IMI 367209]|nr:hypothetical protein N0V90_001857 [Kalmusia sp. IMI 367209]
MARISMSDKQVASPRELWLVRAAALPIYQSSPITFTNEQRSLLDLPDELLLFIVSNLQAIRLEQPQSQAFRDKEKESARQYENYFRRTALHALSLASKRLNRLVVPILCSAIIGSTTRYGIVPLRLFWKTITEKQEMRLHVQYVENLLSDCLGNDLFHDVSAYGIEDMEFTVDFYVVCEYFEKLAGIIGMCQNIQQISVISIESSNFTLWGHLLLPCLENDRRLVVGHGLPKLKTFAFQINSKEEYDESDAPSLITILSSLLQCPSLTVLRASGVVGDRSRTIPFRGTFRNLQRFELTECTLSHQYVDKALIPCENLRHFVCHWSYLWCWISGSTVDLFPNLIRQRQTLETLWLVADKAGFDSTNQSDISCSSLRQLANLKEAKLCNLLIPDKHCRLSAAAGILPIASELPPSLEHLTISYIMQWSNEMFFYPDVWDSLEQLANDCSRCLPRLKELVVHLEGDRTIGGVKMLTDLFEEKGVRFQLVVELDVLTNLG